MRIAIVGCGLIGNKRAKALGSHTLVACADAKMNRAQALADLHAGCIASQNWQQVVEREDVDAVIVSTTNDVLAPASMAAVLAGKHVLLEKPGARTAAELEPLIVAAEKKGVIVKVGFNHRFHPALTKAREIVDSGALGPLMFIRARYGHGGRLGMDREWRGIPHISGGGEMLDQGVHLIDLSRWFLGEFAETHGHVATFFWDWDVEDNGFAMLKTHAGQVAWLHASCTEWKNIFSFEIYGRVGKLHIEGLGGSYGVERLSWYRMLPQMGPPQTSIWEYPCEDLSWGQEFEHFVDCVENKKLPSGNLHDALASLRVVEALYAASSDKNADHA
ncbi:MAG TPA: Gfo/Idh/MocA family oxidoreductase [Tepidisphaeraceae bacterium]|jgi:predicted dehydrogenase|nr:Gfo/Idh/MocA family oxidoreductase [Tepidisphaeraceae bacterium]